MKNIAYLLTMVVVILFTQAASAQSVGFAVGGGLANVDTSDGKGGDGSTYMVSGTISMGLQDDGIGLSYFLGGSWQGTSGADVAGYGSTDITELQIPFGFSFRMKRVALILFGDYRWVDIETESGMDDASGDFLVLGGGLRVPFGPAGTIPGRFALRAVYGSGAGSFNDPGTTNIKEEVTLRDTRVALEYTPSGHWFGRAEYRRADYEGKGNSPLFDQTADSLMLVLGYNF